MWDFNFTFGLANLDHVDSHNFYCEGLYALCIDIANTEEESHLDNNVVCFFFRQNADSSIVLSASVQSGREYNFMTFVRVDEPQSGTFPATVKFTFRDSNGEFIMTYHCPLCYGRY